jgi:hypothetical protein
MSAVQDARTEKVPNLQARQGAWQIDLENEGRNGKGLHGNTIPSQDF